MPVTAAVFHNNFIVSGSGVFLKTYDFENAQLVSDLKVFSKNRVHGILSIFSDLLVVWGSKSYRFINLHDGMLNFNGEELFCKDWIVDMQFKSRESGYILTAHNEVLEYLNGQFTNSYKCSERSILYSGKLFINETTRLVASGTVLNGVVIWDLDTKSIIRNYNDHTGSIFNVCWSDCGRYLASCSDDRAIFLYDLNKGLIASGWGHISRIWKLKFKISKNVQLVSVSEDCTARLWQLEEPQGSLVCNSILTGHTGRNIWSLDIQNDLVVTGGGDGRIMLWDLSMHGSPKHEVHMNMEVVFRGRLRSCAVSADNLLVVSTVDGEIYQARASGGFELIGKLGRMPLVKYADGVFVAVDQAGKMIVVKGTIEYFETNARVSEFHVINRDLVLLGSQIFSTRGNLLAQLACTGVSCTAFYANKLFLGTKRGDLCVYDLSNFQLIATLAKCLEAKVAILTSLTISTEGFIIVTAQNGEYGYFDLETLERIYKDKNRKRGTIEGIKLTPQGSLFYGFQNDSLLVWNASLGYEILSIKCGGAHRAYSVAISEDNSQLNFCYVKSPDFVWASYDLKSANFKLPLVSRGTHGREIRSLDTYNDLVALGSEDTTFSIGKVGKNGFETSCLVRFGHPSAVQCLHWAKNGKYLLTGSGKGELIIWKVTVCKETIVANMVGCTPQSADVNGGLSELRVMEFAVHGDLIAVAYSDSTIRLWEFREGECVLLSTTKYKFYCIFNIDFVEFNNKLLLLVSSSEGTLVTYELSQDYDLAIRNCTKIHQSVIRDVAIMTTEGNIVYYSGGDDNAFACTLIDENFNCTTLFEHLDAHSSAITAVLISGSSIITTSSDQKVKIWSQDGDLRGWFFTDVCDTGVLGVVGNSLLVGGIGISTYRLS